jgi:CDGSH-type Zn-finger protein
MKKEDVTAVTPKIVQLESDKNYAWCSCAKSSNQPWCDGSHRGSGFSPKVFKLQESKKAAICMCKRTKNPPFCDGSHSKM